MKFLKSLVDYFIRRVVKDQRGFIEWAIPAALTAVGMGVNLFGGKKKEQYDPLAGIREQLQRLAGQVPALTARRKELISDLFRTRGEEGKRSIQELMHAERGFGETTIEKDLERKLLSELAKGQAEAELEAELGGLKLQTDILGGTAGMYPAEDTTPSFGTQLMGMGGTLLGQELGYSRLKDLFGGQVIPDYDKYGFYKGGMGTSLPGMGYKPLYT